MINKLDFDISLLSTELLMFCLVVGGNYIGDLFSCGIQDRFNTSMISKHIIGIMTMFFFVVIANKKSDSSISNLIIKTIVLYSIFIGISITDNKYTLPLIVLIFTIFLINIYTTKYLKNMSKEKEENIIKLGEKINKYILIIFILGLTYGILLQYSKKKIQHG